MERIASTYLGTIHLGFALAILVGGATRFPPPTYQPLLDATGGHVWPYGVLYLLSGILLTVGRVPLVRLIGALLGILANSTFAGLFLTAVLIYPEAGATAWWAYFAFATQSACLAALIWTHRRPRETQGG